jgi:hypothetical protein
MSQMICYANKKTVIEFYTLQIICRILGSHGGEYEDGCLLGCSAV